MIFWVGIVLMVVALVVAIYVEVMSPLFDLFRGFVAGFMGARTPLPLTFWEKHKFSAILGSVGLALAIWFF